MKAKGSGLKIVAIQGIGLQYRLASALVGLCLAWAPLAHAQTPAQPLEPQALARAALGDEFGSASVAIWRDGKLAQATVQRAATDAAGPARLATGDGPPPLYEIGSVSKLFTGLLLAQDVARGVLSLDDTLGKLLRGKLNFASRRVAAITLRQLVTHSACLPRQFGGRLHGPAIVNQIRKADRVDLMAALEKQEIAQDAPCLASYSNYGMALLGELLSEQHGKAWDDLVRERIAEPLGLQDTTVHLGEQQQRLAVGYSGRAKAVPWLMDAFAGAGGLRSSVQDMVIFGRALLAGRNGPLGAAAERMLTPLGSYQGRQIGYAVFIHGPPEKRSYSHDGLTGGYRALLIMAPDTGEVLATLVSNAQATLPMVSSQWWAARYPVDDRAIEGDAAALAPLAGIYQLDPELALLAKVFDGRLYLRSNQGGVFRAYVAVAPDRFTRPAGGAQVVFERTAGRVSGLTFEQAGARYSGRYAGPARPDAGVLAPGHAVAYLGRFDVPNAGNPAVGFELREEDGQLLIRSSRFPWAPIFPLAGKPDRFRYDIPDAELQFERGANGQVNAMVLHQNGELRAERVTGTP